MSHDYHPRTEPISADGEEPVFYDGCADCERKAGDPLLWGEDYRRGMWQRMLAVEFGDSRSYRSNAEARAGREMYHLYINLERFFGINPKALDVR